MNVLGISYDSLAVGEDPSQAVVALIAATGPNSAELAELIEEWEAVDPDSLNEFAGAAAQAVAQQAAQQQLAENERQLGEHLEQRRAAALQAVEQFMAGRPDAPDRVPQMIELAQAAGADLAQLDLANPERLHHQLSVMYEAARQIDPDAEPRKDHVSGRFNTSGAWRAQEQERMLNSGSGLNLRNPKAIAAFNEQYQHTGTWADGSGYIHVTPQADVDSVEAAVGPRVGGAEWEAQEQARLAAAWATGPTVAEQLHGRRDVSGQYRAAKAAAEAARPGREQGDPYWNYIEGSPKWRSFGRRFTFPLVRRAATNGANTWTGTARRRNGRACTT